MSQITRLADSFELSDDERKLLPTVDDIEFYLEHGWYLSRKLLTDDEVDELAATADRYYEGERSRRLPVRPPKLAYWDPSKGAVQRHNDYVHYEHASFARLLSKPLIGAVAALLSGASAIRIFQSTLIYKPPLADEVTNLVPWHIDKHYWATSTSEAMLTAFIPFHDCPPDMGTITMVDGSHRWRETGQRDTTVRHFAERNRDELEEMLAANAAFNGTEVTKVPIDIPKGHMNFHHCRMYHGSGANLSSTPRRAVALHLQDGANAYQEVRLSDGTQVSYNHDAVVRRTAAGAPDYADPEFCPLIWQS